jgi:hypothetical protein
MHADSLNVCKRASDIVCTFNTIHLPWTRQRYCTCEMSDEAEFQILSNSSLTYSREPGFFGPVSFWSRIVSQITIKKLANRSTPIKKFASSGRWIEALARPSHPKSESESKPKWEWDFVMPLLHSDAQVFRSRNPSKRSAFGDSIFSNVDPPIQSESQSHFWPSWRGYYRGLVGCTRTADGRFGLTEAADLLFRTASLTFRILKAIEHYFLTGRGFCLSWITFFGLIFQFFGIPTVNPLSKLSEQRFTLWSRRFWFLFFEQLQSQSVIPIDRCQKSSVTNIFVVPD